MPLHYPKTILGNSIIATFSIHLKIKFLKQSVPTVVLAGNRISKKRNTPELLSLTKEPIRQFSLSLISEVIIKLQSY
jgi:hypothetical protein